MTLDLTATFAALPRYSKLIDLVPGGLIVSPQIQPTQLHWANGVASGQANRIVLDQRVLAASGVDDLNLGDGSLLDPFGDPVAFTAIKMAVVWPVVGADGVTIGGAGSGVAWKGPFNGVAYTLTVPLNSYIPFMHPTTGWIVTPGSEDTLRVAAGVSGATYNLLLAGIDA
jgi:hypothetical protein